MSGGAEGIGCPRASLDFSEISDIIFVLLVRGALPPGPGNRVLPPIAF